MLSLLTLQQDCVRSYRRYADTVAVLSAIYHILKQKPLVADYIGIEAKLRNSYGNLITPDLVALYEARTKGAIFELKCSLPFSEGLLDKEVKELKRYAVPCSQWKNSTGKVNYHDLILICHIADSQRLLTRILDVSKEKGFDFLVSDGFAVWAWTISAARGGERREHLIISNVHGKTRNIVIENMIRKPTGLILPEEALTYLRSSFNFIRKKPPIQYTMIMLIQHVFSQFQDPRRSRAVYEITTDMIHDKAKILFPSWHEFAVKTLQIKRRWITEVLEAMLALKMIGKPIGKPETWLIPIPTLKTRKPIEYVLCSKLSKHQLKVRKKPSRKGRPRARPIRMKAHPKMKKLDDYFS